MLENLSDESDKWTYLFNNLSKMNEIPEEFDENQFQDLFTTAKIANFTAEYTEEQKMSYDYQNCLNYAVETAVEAAVKTATEKAQCETARNLLKMGLTAAQIAQATGLSEEEIIKLK